jgi:alkylation response protein AidB-like acyl-CoA dehydrogenase
VNEAALDTGPAATELALLRDLVRDAMRARASSTPDEWWPRSWADDWDPLGELGLWSTFEPPDGSWAAAATVAEEAAKVLYPGPIGEALSGAFLLANLDDCSSLRQVADGSPAAVLVAEGSPCVQPEPESLLLVVTRAGSVVATSAAEVQWSGPPSLDVSRRIARVQLDGTRVKELGSAQDALVRTAQAAKALLYCADTLGCIEHAIARAVEYASQRTTFGAPIGKYQAVAHRLVDHALATQQIRLLLEDALQAANEGADDLTLRVATVETLCHGRSSEIISDCIQLAGAIGFTWEFGHHFYLRRVVVNASLGGGRGRATQRLANEVPW